MNGREAADHSALPMHEVTQRSFASASDGHDVPYHHVRRNGTSWGDLGSINGPGESVGRVDRVTQHDPERAERLIHAVQGWVQPHRCRSAPPGRQLHDVRTEIVGLDDPRERATLPQGCDVPGRGDFRKRSARLYGDATFESTASGTSPSGRSELDTHPASRISRATRGCDSPENRTSSHGEHASKPSQAVGPRADDGVSRRGRARGPRPGGRALPGAGVRRDRGPGRGVRRRGCRRGRR